MPIRRSHQRAITPQNRGGRFPGFDVLALADQWDEVTARVVLARLAVPTALAFFTAQEISVAEPMLDLLLAQDHDPRVPVLALIDQRLAAGETDGWHYDDLPEDGQAWRGSLAALDADATVATTAATPICNAPHRRVYSRMSKTSPIAARLGTTGRPPTCGACGRATRAPRSTPIRGRGMRWASPAPRLPARLPQSRYQCSRRL